MKNILVSLLILSSTFIYSTDFNVTINKKQEESLHASKMSYSQSKHEFDMEEFEEEDYLNNMRIYDTHPTDGWKVFKGLVGLWFGTGFFCSSGKATLLLLMCPDDMLSKIISQSPASLSSLQKFMTHRLVLLSVCSTAMILSAWLLKKSATNLYQGIYATEYDPFEINL